VIAIIELKRWLCSFFGQVLTETTTDSTTANCAILCLLLIKIRMSYLRQYIENIFGRVRINVSCLKKSRFILIYHKSHQLIST